MSKLSEKFHWPNRVLRQHFCNLCLCRALFGPGSTGSQTYFKQNVFQTASGNFTRNFKYCLFHVRNTQCIFHQNDWDVVILFADLSFNHTSQIFLLLVYNHARLDQASCSSREALLHAWMILEPAWFLKIDFSNLAGVSFEILCLSLLVSMIDFCLLLLWTSNSNEYLTNPAKYMRNSKPFEIQFLNLKPTDHLFKNVTVRVIEFKVLSHELSEKVYDSFSPVCQAG